MARTLKHHSVELTPRHGLVSSVRSLQRQSKTKVGGDGPVAQEAVVFRNDASWSFPTGDIAALRELDNGKCEITTTFLGLFGGHSPLPQHYSEHALSLDENPNGRDFFDLVHHRIVSLLYRGLSKYDWAHELDADFSDFWSAQMLALSGVHVSESERRTRLQLSSFICRRGQSADDVKAVVLQTLHPYVQDVAVSIDEFVPSRVAVPDEQQCRLGRAQCTLGIDTILGGHVVDTSGHFNVVLGPLNRATFTRVTATVEIQNQINTTLDGWLKQPLTFDIVLELERGAVPQMQLGAASTVQLGRTCSLGEHSVARRLTLPTSAKAKANPDERNWI
jgi:type VI secretion system protein ImpH